MSQEPHPKTDRTSPGSTPAHGPGASAELERQRAEGDLPGRPTRDPLREPLDDQTDGKNRVGEDEETDEDPTNAEGSSREGER